MQITIEHSDDRTITVNIAGEMDELGCNDARPVFEQLVETHSNNHILLNLGQATFLDSSGIGAIVFLLKRLRTAGGDLSICNVNGQPRELIRTLVALARSGRA